MASFTAMDLSEDNGSFQNQPPSASALAKKRRRGMTCVLTEVNPNVSSLESARESKTAAEAKIKGLEQLLEGADVMLLFSS